MRIVPTRKANASPGKMAQKVSVPVRAAIPPKKMRIPATTKPRYYVGNVLNGQSQP